MPVAGGSKGRNWRVDGNAAAAGVDYNAFALRWQEIRGAQPPDDSAPAACHAAPMAGKTPPQDFLAHDPPSPGESQRRSKTSPPNGGTSKRDARGERKSPRKVTARSLHNAALHYLARFSAPSGHLRRVLLRRVAKSAKAHGTDAAEGRRLVDELIERFCRAGLLDDAAYGAAKARSLHRRGASGVAIGRALRAKGLSPQEADAALAALSAAGEGSSEARDIAAAARLAQRKRLGPFRRPAERADRRDRDLAALARAGFSYAVARRIVDAGDDELETIVRNESF